MSRLSPISILCFVLGVVPLLALAFFSPGIRSEGPTGVLIAVFGVITLLVLTQAARRNKPLWMLVVFQALLLAAVLFQTLSDARLYIGT